MSIKFKLAVGFGLMLVILAAQGWIARGVFTEQSLTLKNMVLREAVFESLSRDIDNCMLMHRRFEKSFFMGVGNKNEQADYRRKLSDQSARMQSLLTKTLEMGKTIPSLPQEAGLKLNGLESLYTDYFNGLRKLMDRMEKDASITTQQADSLMDPFKKSIRILEEDIESVAQAAQNHMRRGTEKALSSASHAASTLLILTSAGGAAALLLSFFIGLSIIRPLSRLTLFADRVADGDFSAEIEIGAGGEIGLLARSIDGVKSSLVRMLAEIDRVDNAVTQGRILERGDMGAFHGDFQSLVQNVNELADTLTKYLDSVPAPLMLIDRNYKVLYMNKAGTDAGGAAPRSQAGRQCYDFFKTGDCHSDRCACRQAMDSEQGAASETTASPGGNALDIAYTAQPVHDKEGRVVGALEIVTDQTAIKKAQRKMNALARTAGEIAERVSTASEELSAQVEQVSNGTKLQRERISETAAAMEEMNATVLEVARNAGIASTSSESTRDQAGSGEGVVERAVAAINRVHDVSIELKRNMGLLGEQAESIGGVMNVISDIADQTNLLALNAAIEAARAGEAGRGFAVVADEVRKLAEKTMSATSEVGQKIQAIQDASVRNIGNMDQAAEAVEEATEMANRSGLALKDIVRLSGDSAGMVQSIATAAEQQSAASEEINRALEEIHSVVAETADGMAQSSQAVGELSRQTVELRKLILELHQGNAA